jgi:Leucine-rich repeat (LRR) protein
MRQPARKIWRSDADAAFEEATRRVAAAAAEGPSEYDVQVLDFRGLDALTRLPDLNAVPRLTDIDISGTAVADLSPLASMDQLGVVRASRTPIADIAFVGGTPRLGQLAINLTTVDDLSPLRPLKELWFLSISGTPVADLSPLALLPKLAWLEMEATPVTDLSPLSGLHTLQDLNIVRSQVTDLEPLASLSEIGVLRYLAASRDRIQDWSGLAQHAGLARAAVDRPQSRGLHFFGGVAADPELDRLSRLQTPQATVFFINRLRQSQGLLPYWPKKYQGPRDIDPAIPNQDDPTTLVPAQRLHATRKVAHAATPTALPLKWPPNFFGGL